jgi:hypothetical protein
MVDYVTYRKLHQKEKSILKRRPGNQSSDQVVEIPEKVGPIGDELYLFPTTIVGFNLRRKKWGMQSCNLFGFPMKLTMSCRRSSS